MKIDLRACLHGGGGPQVGEVFRYFYLFATQLHYLKMPKEKKKCRKRWRGGLKETIELMLIRPYVNYVNCYFDISRGVNLLHKNDHNNFSGANCKCVKSRPRLESKGL